MSSRYDLRVIVQASFDPDSPDATDQIARASEQAGQRTSLLNGRPSGYLRQFTKSTSLLGESQPAQWVLYEGVLGLGENGQKLYLQLLYWDSQTGPLTDFEVVSMADGPWEGRQPQPLSPAHVSSTLGGFAGWFKDLLEGRYVHA